VQPAASARPTENAPLVFLLLGCLLQIRKNNHALKLLVRLFRARAFFSWSFSQAKPSPLRPHQTSKPGRFVTRQSEENKRARKNKKK
jgi:hypothetical protein